MNSQDIRSEHYFLRPIGFSTSRALKCPKPAPIKTTHIRAASIRNTTTYIENTTSQASESVNSQYSPLSSALSTPRAIITAIPWKLRSRPTTAASPSSAFSFSATSPSFKQSAFQFSASPMESSSLPSGRVLKSPFSYSGSPYPYSPPISAYESRLSPNTYRNVSRIDTNVQCGSLSTPIGRNMPTPISNRRTRRNHPQPVDSPIDASPITPVADELEYPIILDPVTPKNYTFGTPITPVTLPSSKESPRPIRTRTRKDSLKRARAPSRQDLRSQGAASQRITSAPHTRLEEEPNFLLPTTVYDPNQTVTASKASEKNEPYLPNKRSRRQHSIDLDGYSHPSQTRQQSYTGISN
jgi:hypothetical protein